MDKKFLNIRIVGEKNIGVIDLGDFKGIHTMEDVEKKIRESMESKLVEALQSHFDCEIKVIFPHVKQLNPIAIKVDVIIKDMDEDRQEVVFLEETWVY